MQIGEEDLPAPEPRALGLQRLLDLHDQLGALENLVGIGHDLRPGRDIVGVGDAGARARVLLRP